LAYFDAAVRFLTPVPPKLIAIGGLSGTGKSTLAAAIAPSLGLAPGAVHLRSDVERKRLFAVAETTRLPAEAYRREVTATIYGKLQELAEKALRAGRAVIVDATNHHLDEREATAAVASRAGVPFLGLWLEAPADVLTRRVMDRRGDASDATADIVAAQVREPIGPVSWRRLDASQPLHGLTTAALDLARNI
jgi:predicted kinase